MGFGFEWLLRALRQALNLKTHLSRAVLGGSKGMNLQNKKNQLVEEFKVLSNWEERYKKLIEMGKQLPPMNEAHKVERNQVKGCQSQVWLWAELKGGRVYLTADSDAAIAKGIVALLVDLYSEATPGEILSLDQCFIDELGLKQHLSMNRANGLANMLKQVQLYALALQAKAKMGL